MGCGGVGGGGETSRQVKGILAAGRLLHCSFSTNSPSLGGATFHFLNDIIAFPREANASRAAGHFQRLGIPAAQRLRQARPPLNAWANADDAPDRG